MKEYSRRNFIEILLFILLINLLVFVSISWLHELGHAVYGAISGCENISVVLDIERASFHTMMECSSPLSNLMTYWSSFLLLLPISVAFLLLEDFKVAYVGYIMLGGNIMGSVADAAVYSQSLILRYFLILVGLVLIIIGEDRMIQLTVRQRTPLSPLQQEQDEEDKNAEDEHEERNDDDADAAASSDGGGGSGRSDGAHDPA